MTYGRIYFVSIIYTLEGPSEEASLRTSQIFVTKWLSVIFGSEYKIISISISVCKLIVIVSIKVALDLNLIISFN